MIIPLLKKVIKSKYGNKKVEFDGIKFDSAKESRRYMELRILLRAGKIRDLELQKEFELIPKQKATHETYRAIKYRADFCYRLNDSDRMIVEDVKGYRTEVYNLKKKLMYYIHHIEIHEI